MFGIFSFFTTYWVSIPNSFVSLFIFYILSYLLSKTMGCLSGAWCPPPVSRSCFVEFSQCPNDLLMNLWGRKWFPHPIPLPSPCPLFFLRVYFLGMWTIFNVFIDFFYNIAPVLCFVCLFVCDACRILAP